MKITQLLDRNSISLDASPKSKKEALDLAVDLMVKSGKINHPEAYREQVYLREEEGSTGVGDGIAIPHGRGSSVTKPGLAAMVIPEGVDFDALDEEPVYLVFLIAAPDTKDNVHLDVLSRLSVLLMDEVLVKRLIQAKSVDAFLAILDEKDRAGDEAGLAENETDNPGAQAAEERKPRILAVTSCPTGIAHTYMAAEGLEKAAAAAGCSIKVETRGSGGAKNVLTDREIGEADCIIVAADAKVPMDRFHGKRVIECKVSDGIRKGGELIERAIHGDVPLYQGTGDGAAPAAEDKKSAGHKIYTQLMNGVSHMLPFVVGGGILIAISFLIDGLFVDMESLSADMRGEFGTITPAAAVFKNIGGAAFGFMLPILAGFIAMSIGDRPALALGIVGGAMAANGKSGFLGALLAGFLAGYVVLLLRRVFERLPDSIEKIAPVLLYPVLGILAVGVIMAYVVEPPVGALNMALNTGLTNMGSGSKLFLGMVVAGMMSIDMGGPFNKAAYVFGTASIAAGNYDIMAAVMVGGMVPPCAIALSTMIFRTKYTKQERESGPANFIMGLAFITEGAIPYAASDPLRVLPSCIIGSAVAGGLSMASRCTLMAPHGGIFVFPVMGHPWMYLLALVAGTAAAAVLLGLVKRPVKTA